jgi:hypothetical protein
MIGDSIIEMTDDVTIDGQTSEPPVDVNEPLSLKSRRRLSSA